MPDQNSPYPLSNVQQIRAALHAAYGDAYAALEGSGAVTVVQNRDEAAQVIVRARAAMAADMGVGMGNGRSGRTGFSLDGAGDIQGFYDPVSRKSLLVADFLREENATAVLTHEVGVHMRSHLAEGNYRLEAMFSDLFAQARRLVMQGAVQGSNQGGDEGGNDPFLQKVRERLMDSGVTRQQLQMGAFSGEEAAAYIAEQYEVDRARAPRSVRSWFSRMKAGVRAWIHERTGLLPAHQLRPADIAQIARGSVSSMAREASRQVERQQVAGQQAADATIQPPSPLASATPSATPSAIPGMPDAVLASRASAPGQERPAQGTMGMKMAGGQVALTSTGRETLPFPVVDTSTSRKLTNTLRRVTSWLMESALEEAQARGDDFNVRYFQQVKDRPLPADQDMAEAYLFDPDAVFPVPTPVLKPLVKPLQETLTEQIDSDRSTKNIRFSVAEAPTTLLAPNGQASRLDARLHAMVRTPEFKQWFGDWEADPVSSSQALDENGEPKVFYHGTPKAGFTVFDSEQGREIRGTPGVFFTDDFTMAKTYSGSKDDAPVYSPQQLFEDPSLMDGLDIRQEGMLVEVTVNDQGKTEWIWYEDEEAALEELELDEGEERLNTRTAYILEAPDGESFTGSKEEILRELVDVQPDRMKGVYSVFLNVRDMVLADWGMENWSEGPKEDVWNIVEDTGEVLDCCYEEDEADRLLASLKERYPDLDLSIEKTEQAIYEDTNDAARTAFYMNADGIYLKDVFDPGPFSYGGEYGNVLVVFDPANIKSINNSGEFMRGNDDIRFSHAPGNAARKAKPAGGEAIGDFGEKIGGARKDAWRERQQDMLSRVTDAELATTPLSKIWPAPDYDKLRESGMGERELAWLHALRDSIADKPRGSGIRARIMLDAWSERARVCREAAKGILAGTIPAEQLTPDQDGFPAQLTVGGKEIDGKVGFLAQLYEIAGHEGSLADCRLVHGRMRNAEGLSGPTYAISVDGRYGIKGGPLDGLSWQQGWHFAGKDYPAVLEAMRVHVREYRQEQARQAQQLVQQQQGEQARVDQVAGKATRKGRSYEARHFAMYTEQGMGRRDGVFIGRYVGKHMACLAGPFDSLQAARDWRGAHVEELASRLEHYRQVPQERHAENRPRIGEEWRVAGEDVTPEQFLAAFPFRGVEFGNWVEQGRRQQDLNQAYDALLDLAGVLEVDPRSLALQGELGLAFGARGSGGKDAPKAHYESEFTVMNLTKKSGAGSLAHEWFHALDQHVLRLVTNGALRNGFASTDGAAVSIQASIHGGHNPLLHAFGRVMRALSETGIGQRSARLDERRTTPYWALGEEQAARAFERWVVWELEQAGCSNDYLANLVDEQTWKAAEEMGLDLEGSYPYPLEAEMPVVAEAFRELVNVIRQHEVLPEQEQVGVEVSAERERMMN